MMLQTPLLFFQGIDSGTKKIFWYCLIISLILHGLAAVYSLGFYHLDEHHQILEFAALKLGWTDAKSLAWEYGSQIRPAAQPLLVSGFVKLSGITDRFEIAMLFRIFSGILGFCALWLFALFGLQWIKNIKLQRALLVLSAVIPYLAFYHVRYSSESWSGSFFFLGLSAFLYSRTSKSQSGKTNDLAWLSLAGLCFGLAFVFRMQIMLMFPGFFLWCLIREKLPFGKILLMGFTLLVGIAIGFIADHHFYGEWINTAWNYAKVNILEGKASSFGTAPWTYYMSETMNIGTFPFGFLLVSGVLIGWLRRTGHIITWTIFPFFALHCLIAHKELRFLFPMLNAVPLLLIIALDGIALTFILKEKMLEVIMTVNEAKIRMHTKIADFLIVLSRPKALKWIRYSIVALTAIQTFTWVQAICLKPANEIFYCLKYLNENYFDKEFTLISIEKYDGPFENGVILPMNFYRPPALHRYSTMKPDSIRLLSKLGNYPVFLLGRTKGYKPPLVLDSAEIPFAQEYFSLDKSFKKYDFNHWVARTPMWAVFNLRPDLVKPKKEEDL